MSKNKYTNKEKLNIVKEYLDGHTSYFKLGQKYGLNESSIRKWISKFQTFGEDAFTIPTANLNYNADFKHKVVQAYLNGDGSYKDIAIKFKIHAASTVLQWVKSYNNHEELLNSRPKGVFNMVNTNGRKTDFEERIKIVEYCIAHDNDYAATALKFNVSYNQVYSWVHKYNIKGVDALIDRRGKTKDNNEISELDKLKIENRMLQARNKQQEMEINFLKKIEEVERR